MNKTDPPTTLGVFKPVGHTLIAFDTAGAQQFAVVALKALGFLASSMVQYSALEMAAQIEKELLSASPLATFGHELDLMHRHADLAQKGCSFLVVHAPTDALAARVAELVHSIQPASAQHYGRFMIEDLTEKAPGRMGELEVLPPPAPHSRTLDEQKADFTAEGSPAPGKVGNAKPVREQASDFVEGREDPNQSKELERQQDA